MRWWNDEKLWLGYERAVGKKSKQCYEREVIWLRYECDEPVDLYEREVVSKLFPKYRECRTKIFQRNFLTKIFLTYQFEKTCSTTHISLEFFKNIPKTKWCVSSFFDLASFVMIPSRIRHPQNFWRSLDEYCQMSRNCEIWSKCDLLQNKQ